MKAEINNSRIRNHRKEVWKNVKIEGNIMSDECIGLEGLIGLEVMDSYDPNLLTIGKKKLKPWQEKRNLKKLNILNKDKSSDYSDSRSLKAITKSHPNKIQKKKQKTSSKQQFGKNNSPGQFVLLKNQNFNNEGSNSEEDEINAIEETSNSINFDDLEGWNGLGIPDNILRALAENNYKSPTQIQALTLPAAILGKKDILGAAETGSGKTLAFAIPILTGIMELKNRNLKSGIRKKNSKKIERIKPFERDNCTPPPEELNIYPQVPGEVEDNASEELEDDNINNKPLYAIVLTPTRELAVQVRNHIVVAAKYTGIQVVAIFGGLAAPKQERLLKKCPEIVVATPGRLWELLDNGNKHLNKIDDISFLVIDETDRMLEKGHFDELQLLLKRLNTEGGNRESRQNFIFSATLTLVHDLPDYLKKKNMGKKIKLTKQTSEEKIQNLIDELGISQPKIVDITNTNQLAQNLTECRIICSIDEKDYYLYYFIQKHPGRTIVFCNSIDCVKRLAQLFSILNCQSLPLHAQMMQKQRLKNLEKFCDNPNGLLIATDVAARGLDITNVHHVVHYQVPRTSENYVHRSGRTARANKDGLTIILMEPGEVKNYLKLCKTLNRSKDLPLFPIAENFMRSVKERVNIAREVDKTELRLKKTATEEGWIKKSAEEMDIIVDDIEDNPSSDDETAMEKSKEKQYLFNKRQTLASLLSKPIFPKGYSYKYPTSSGKLELPFTQTELNDDNSAVIVMKNAIEEMKVVKKQRNKRNNSNNKRKGKHL